jgi:anti-sigma regulatory factor (Ser/Thr protein kinase)
MTDPKTIAVAIKNDLSEIERLSHIVNDFVTCNHLPSKVAFDLNLALDEILTNVISYGYDGGEHLINIRGAVADEIITIEVEDDGRPFDPLATPEPDLNAALDERPIGGLGIHLVRKLTDQQEYRRHEGKNLLILKKNM